MRNLFEYIISASVLLLASLSASAQTDRREVRAGNRQFRKENFQKAEIDYRKALVKDSSSFAATYNLASSLYRQENFDEAGKTLEKAKDVAPMSPNASDYYYNLGNVACQKKDWQAAVDAYKQSLLRNPGDMDAKENYAYAKLMLKNQGGGGGGGNGQNNQNQQNQDQNQNGQGQNQQDQNQNQNQDQNQQNQNQNQNGQGQQGQGKISPQQAQQMLNAIQAKEKETQDKVNKEKAALLKSKQKEKNW